LAQLAPTATPQVRSITTRPYGRIQIAADPDDSSAFDSLPGDEQAAQTQQAQQQRLQELQHSQSLQLQQRQEERQQLINQRQEALRSVLEDTKLSFPAVMAVLRRSAVRQFNPDIIGPRVRQLQEAFGAATVNAMLSIEPELLERSADRMIQGFNGLSQLLGAGDEFAREIASRCPSLLANRRELMQARLQRMGELLQVCCCNDNDSNDPCKPYLPAFVRAGALMLWQLLWMMRESLLAVRVSELPQCRNCPVVLPMCCAQA
jgi:hypothetical protein